MTRSVIQAIACLGQFLPLGRCPQRPEVRRLEAIIDIAPWPFEKIALT